jgi:hypothetical protein
MSLGSTLSVGVRLTNHRSEGDVMGVRMMLEVQGPAGRYRLGEVIHGVKQASAEGEGDEKEGGKSDGQDTSQKQPLEGPAEPGVRRFPELAPGNSVELDISAEMKEMGLQVLICSVAWETMDGRRTFQRFFKFNVGVTPLFACCQ